MIFFKNFYKNKIIFFKNSCKNHMFNPKINSTLEKFLMKKKILVLFKENMEDQNQISAYDIDTGFTWKDTPEGHYYWNGLQIEFLTFKNNS